MKKWVSKLLPSFLMCVVGVFAILIGITYFNFISQRIYEDSTGHLEEIYGQVNRSFGAFVDRNWGLLESWEDYLSLAKDNSGDTVSEFLAGEQGYWGFSEFYFLSSGKQTMTADGDRGAMALEDAWDRLIEQREPVMAGETLPTGQEITVFAVPVSHGVYQGFGYDAIAISYTNADLSSSLKVDAFSGNAKCFVIHSDGGVLLSTLSGGGVFGNYLVYLQAASDLDEETLSQLQTDWSGGKSGLLQCRIGGVSHYILYQDIGYQDYLLLCVVPQSEVGAGFLSVQQTTMLVLIIIFLMLGGMVIIPIILSTRQQARRNRMELRYRDLLFDVLSNSVDDIFLMLDARDQRVDYLSPNVERLLGIPAQAARENIRVMEKCAINGDVFIAKEELEAIPLHSSVYRECEYMHQSTGERRWYRITVYHAGGQEANKYIFVLSDRTQERQMNQKLQEALNAARSANEAKSNFLSNMSHDIRTPMNAIVGFSVLLEKDADNVGKVREYTRKIKASSQHLLSLINGVLDMSKIESGKTSLHVEQFSLPELLEELNIILTPQTRAKHQQFEIHVHGTPPEQLLGDKLRLKQILINLLSNAVKYTPDGGRINFQISELPQAASQFVKLRFLVRDNGIGMSEEFQKQIFVPFSREVNSVTNKIQGTGLGMAITKNLVDLMGGIIRLESQAGQGSTFTVELSFALPEQVETESWFRQKITRMLAVGCQEDLRPDIQEALANADVAVTFLPDGPEAAEAASAAHSSGEDFHVILLDWKEHSSLETVRLIRERVGGAVPILALTSSDWNGAETEARQAGINAFLSKPFFPSTFWRALKPLFLAHGDQADHSGSQNDAMAGRLFLVAEDNELNAEILTEMLDMEGARCELAANGREAVELFLRSEPGYYDMILMDVRMPVMNGYEATRQIRASAHPEAATIPIVAMTANTFAEDVRDALDAGMNGHLAKPIDMDTVRELVGQLLKATVKDAPPPGGEEGEHTP